MMAEPLKATFFTLRRRDRAVLLPATIVLLVIVALIVAGFIALNWNTLTHLAEFVPTMAQQDPEEVDQTAAMNFVFGMFGLFGTGLLFLFPLYVALAAYEAACLRWMIRGEAPGLFGLALNNDTWRVYGVYWVWFVGQMAVSMACSMVLLPFMFADMGELARSQDPDAAWRWQLKFQLISLVQYVPLLLLGPRLAPAAATAIARRRFSFFEAWSATEDRYFAMLGSFALITVPAIAIYVAVSLGASLAYYGSWAEVVAMWTRPPTPEQAREAWQAGLTARSLTISAVSLGVILVLWLVWTLLSFGINARAAMAALDEGKIQVDPAD
jgi:hypothetical protein